MVRQDCDQFLNALLLVAFYLLIVRDMTPTQIVQHLASLIEAAPKRHYKTEGELMEDDMPITIQHCLEGLQMAMELGLLRLEELDIDEYYYQLGVSNVNAKLSFFLAPPHFHVELLCVSIPLMEI